MPFLSRSFLAGWVHMSLNILKLFGKGWKHFHILWNCNVCQILLISARWWIDNYQNTDPIPNLTYLPVGSPVINTILLMKYTCSTKHLSTSFTVLMSIFNVLLTCRFNGNICTNLPISIHLKSLNRLLNILHFLRHRRVYNDNFILWNT